MFRPDDETAKDLVYIPSNATEAALANRLPLRINGAKQHGFDAQRRASEHLTQPGTAPSYRFVATLRLSATASIYSVERWESTTV